MIVNNAININKMNNRLNNVNRKKHHDIWSYIYRSCIGQAQKCGGVNRLMGSQVTHVLNIVRFNGDR